MKKYITCFYLGLFSIINLFIYMLSIEPHLTVVDAFGRGNDPYNQFMSVYFSFNLGILILAVALAVVLKIMESPKLKKNRVETTLTHEETLDGSPLTR